MTDVEHDYPHIDADWLDIINNARRGQGVGAAADEAFEITMDRLEKEWHELVRISVLPVAAENGKL